jgi:IMP dehydrogenase
MKSIKTALTFDDILLVPGKSSVLPRDVSIETRLTRETSYCAGIKLSFPIVSAAMDTVTEYEMAIALAQEGGVGVIHKNMSMANQVKNILRVKKFESGVVLDPVTVNHDVSIHEVINNRQTFSSMPVMQGDKLVGLVTNRDLRFVTNKNIKISDVMTPLERLITIQEGEGAEKAINLMHQHRIEKVLVLEGEKLVGMMTARDVLNSKAKPLATKDSKGRLIVGAAIGVGDESCERARGLIGAGCDFLVVDTAHGHSDGVLKQVEWVKENYSHIPVIAGNIVTAEAALDLVSAGADAVKVGVGPGSICTTRVIAGAGMPQVTAIMNIAEALKGEVPIIADGGIRYSGDITKAVAAGASSVMMGSIFAGCKESPGDVELYQGRAYKVYRGMGSINAMAQKHGSSDRYFQDSNAVDKLVPEGVEGRVAYKGYVKQVIHQLVGGLRSGMGYTGCKDLESLQKYDNIVQISSAGIKESHVHDVTITKETTNYYTDN